MRVGFVGRDPPLDPHEEAISREASRELLHVEVKNLRDASRDRFRVLVHRFETPGIRIDAVDVRTYCKLGSVPVVDRASPWRDSKLTKVLTFRHLAQAIARGDLNVERADDDEHGDHRSRMLLATQFEP